MPQETFPIEDRKTTSASKLKVGVKCEGNWAWDADRIVSSIDTEARIVTFDNGDKVSFDDKVTTIKIRQSKTPSWENFR